MGVVVVAFLTTMISNLWSAYRMITETLTENTLETNRVYAQKLASTADLYLEETFNTLKFSANEIANSMDDELALANEAERLHTQDHMFNAVVIADRQGVVIGISPPSVEIKGVTLTSEGPLEALEKREPIISKPYEAVTGKLVIFISHPIFAENGDYLGFVGVTIYIKEDNIFHSLLGQHYYDDGSYVFVVDGDGRIIYHEDPSRLDDVVLDNEVVQKVVNGEHGAQAVKNTKGTEMLAGYSPIKLADWGVIAQRPTEAALAPAASLVKRLAMISMPFAFIALIIVLWMAAKIATPLQQMATLTERSLKTKKVDELNAVSSWYYETYTLKNALVKSLSLLHNQVSFFKTQSSTDPLTGLTNRRTMDTVLERWTKEKVGYALLLIDLDHFKNINDTYGHGVGDDVLKYLAKKMQQYKSEEAICCRYGGEEFIMLMPYTTEEEALVIAERLRVDLEQTTSPCGRPITMSGGIALAQEVGDIPSKVVEMADKALYAAKQAGRNRVLVAKHHRQ